MSGSGDADSTGTILGAEETKAALRANERRLVNQREAFQAAINGATLAEALSPLARLVAEELAGEGRSAFYIADPAVASLHTIRGAGTMPDAHADQIDGFGIGLDSLACGLSTSTGRPVVSPDVFEEPRWAPWVHVAREFDYRGCWSFPIDTRDGRTVGTFALYFRTVREPAPHELALADLVTQTAAIIIARHTEAEERARAEAALQDSEAKYRSLFDTMAEGFAVCGVVRDAEGRVIDLSYVELNEALARLTGLDREGMIGRRLTDVFPPADSQRWLPIYARVVESGGPTTFELNAELLGRWYEVSVYPRGKEQISIVFRETTERKEAEAALRASEERQAYLLKLSDALRPLADPTEVQLVASRILGEHTGVSRVLYGDVIDERQVVISRNYVDGVEPIVGRLDAEAFGRETVDAYRRNEKVIFEDVATDPRFTEEERRNYASIGVVANASMGLLKDGHWVAAFGMHNATPRVWTPMEIALLEDTAERTWAAVERARAEAALREREERQAFLLRLSDETRPLLDPVEIQEAAMKLLAEHLDVMRATYFEVDADQDGFTLTARCERDAAPIPERMRLSDFAPDMADAYRSGRTLVFRDTEAETQLGSRPEAYRPIGVRAWAAVPLVKQGRLLAIVGVHSGTPRDWTEEEVHVLEDVAERTWSAAELLRLQRYTDELNAFLVRFSDAVRGLTDARVIAEAACRMLAEELGVERAHWAEVDLTTREYVIGGAFHLPGVPVITGRFPFGAWEPFTSSLLAGRHVVVGDVEASARIPPELKAGYVQLAVGADLAVPVLVDGQLRCTLAVNQRLPRRWTPEEVALVSSVAGRCWAEVERARAEAALTAERERLAVAEAVAIERWALLGQVVRAQEEERRRVAHEVHDSVTQLAHAAALRLDALVEDLAPTIPPADRRDLERARDLARSAAQEARRLIAGLRPETLDQFGLVGALQAEVQALRADGWKATFRDGSLTGVRLGEEVEITLYRVAQEALTNVRKHAGKTSVHVEVRRRDGHVRLTVRDRGIGFDPSGGRRDGDPSRHVGLVGMRERVELLGGTFALRSAPGTGTRVEVTLPLTLTHQAGTDDG